MLRILDRSNFRFFGRWTQVLFLIASFIAVIVTLVSFSGIGPIRPASQSMFWLLVVNFVLIGALAVYVSLDFFALSSGAQSSGAEGQGRLARRFAGFFSLAAVLPAILVALFLGTSLNRGIENWFSERIQGLVEGSADIARSNLEAIAEDIRLDVGIMGLDLNAAVVGFETEPDVFQRYLLEQAQFREFPGAFLIDDTGQLLLSSDEVSRRAFIPPSLDMFETAKAGDVSVVLNNRSSQFWALYQLEDYNNTFLWVSRPIDPALLNGLLRTEETLSDYRAAEERSRRLQIIFLLGFVQITALILLFFIRYGFHAASQISRPIASLASAADDVRKGHLSVQVPMPKQDNEVADLTASFNAMTEKLREQRDAIDRAHKETIEHSRFIEAVLEGVTAGVVRVDEELNVTLYNTSAARMCPDLETHEKGAGLEDIAPQFAGLARQSILEKTRKEKTVVVDQDGVQTHFLLRASPALEGDEGCILTFDDTTRLISAQRQTAWRDVARRIAHEIRNPLTPIQLSTERLRRRYRDLAGTEDTVFDKCTDTIFRQVTDIGRMVEEFSSFARMPKPEVREFEFVDILRSAVFGSRLSLPDTDITLNTSSESITLSGDERLLSQALTNLIKNAGEAIDRLEEPPEYGGQIAVSATIEDHAVVVEIEDNGPGFPIENRNQFLEPYFTTREQGVGLGLAIVNRIVEDHGGQLTLLDRADGTHGARISIRLPLSGPSPETVSSWTFSEERV